MLRRWTRERRLRAAWLLALVYVLAVLSPAVANALSVRASEASPQSVAHDSVAHDHAAHSHDHDHAAAHDHAPTHDHSDHGNDGDRVGDLNCCGLACISALPAHDIDVARRDRVLSVTISFLSQESAGRAPPLLYRPPIS